MASDTTSFFLQSVMFSSFSQLHLCIKWHLIQIFFVFKKVQCFSFFLKYIYLCVYLYVVFNKIWKRKECVAKTSFKVQNLIIKFINF